MLFGAIMICVAVWLIGRDLRANGRALPGGIAFGRGGDRVLEVHLFDFEGDMYGRLLRVESVTLKPDSLGFPNLRAEIGALREATLMLRLVPNSPFGSTSRRISCKASRLNRSTVASGLPPHGDVPVLPPIA